MPCSYERPPQATGAKAADAMKVRRDRFILLPIVDSLSG
jgi:hypothetical protein